MSALLPVDVAIRRILAGVTPLESESVGIAEAGGRVLSEPLAAKRTQPPFDSSAMDGYAVRAADVAAVPARLKVIGMAAAGRRFEDTVAAGEAVRIFTGAPVPEGADAVLIQEDVEVPVPDLMIARKTVAAGRHIRLAGQDFKEGASLIGAGTKLGPRQIALAAAMGHGRMPLVRRPQIAVVSTGDELVEPGVSPGPDQIVASNACSITAFASTIGAAASDLGIVSDDRAAIANAVDEAMALPADILVTLGGASVGDHDLVQAALGDRGMKLDFWRIAMRPGKPLMFGRVPRSGMGTTLRVLGLPGNPVSSVVCALLFLRPLVDALLGLPQRDPSELAMIGMDMPANGGRQDYVRATLIEAAGGPPTATPQPVQDSAMLSALAKADCLIIRPPDAPMIVD